jgi:hypothetical protein
MAYLYMGEAARGRHYRCKRGNPVLSKRAMPLSGLEFRPVPITNCILLRTLRRSRNKRMEEAFPIWQDTSGGPRKRVGEYPASK